MKLLKKFSEKISPKYKQKLRPFWTRFHYLICLLTFQKTYSDSIGSINLSFFVWPWLKKSVAQQGEDLILDRIINRILCWDINSPFTYEDVGGYHPIKESVTYFLYLKSWRGVVFDPSVETKKSFRF